MMQLVFILLSISSFYRLLHSVFCTSTKLLVPLMIEPRALEEKSTALKGQGSEVPAVVDILYGSGLEEDMKHKWNSKL